MQFLLPQNEDYTLTGAAMTKISYLLSRRRRDLNGNSKMALKLLNSFLQNSLLKSASFKTIHQN
jgi:hypothetical protein